MPLAKVGELEPDLELNLRRWCIEEAHSACKENGDFENSISYAQDVYDWIKSGKVPADE